MYTLKAIKILKREETPSIVLQDEVKNWLKGVSLKDNQKNRYH